MATRQALSLLGIGFVVLPAAVAVVAACGAGNTDDVDGSGNSGNGGSSTLNPDSTGSFIGTGGSGGGSSSSGGDPKTCAEAANSKTYIGCDFWPTVTANQVWDIFDYAVVVANAGDTPGDVTVTQGGTTIATATVQPNGLSTIYLPWVKDLKGQDFDACTYVVPMTASVRSTVGAYHLVSTTPITVYQFSALEFLGQGGPPGKNWSTCPGLQCGLACASYSNDASLLLPSTAMTGNYRITGMPGWPAAGLGPAVTVTGLQDGTNVTAFLGAAGGILGGGGIPATNGGGQTTFTLNQGEVVELVGGASNDFSGSLIKADKPVQVIHAHPCRYVPDDAGACDHLEETVLPAETLGQHYVVSAPTGPGGAGVPQLVRIHGNVDGTTLTYPAGMPPGAPSTINAGQVVDLGSVAQSFEIQGDHEFAIATFQLGAQAINPDGGLDALGDPAQSSSTAVEQYRLKYVFLAPADYTESYVDVVMPTGATITLDGANVPVSPEPVGAFGVARIPLSGAGGGAHVLTASAPVGIQVIGYGAYTSYQYPGGLNLDAIAPPPPPPQ